MGTENPIAVKPLAGAQLNKRLLRWSSQEIRHGQLWPISIALTLIVACVFALSALAERMEQVVIKEGRDALTADLVYSSAQSVPESLDKALITAQSVSSARMIRFSTMAFSETEMQLITVKAVDSAYPLRGELQLATTESDASARSVKPGELWLDERIFMALNVEVGDAITLGDADLVVSGRIAQEPGLSFNPFQQMPTAYIHESDVEKTGALQLGSRVRFNLYLIGDSDQLNLLKQSVTLTPSDSWTDQSTESRNNNLFDRTSQYLSLTVAIVIIMAATTLVLTCQNYVNGRRKTVAMLKSLGASRAWLIRWLGIQLLLLLLIGVLFGTLSGVLLEILLRVPLTDLLPDPLPSYGGKPALIAILTCVLIGIPALGIPILNLIDTSAVNVMQPIAQARNRLVYLLVLVPVVPMLIVYQSNSLVWLVLLGIVALFIALGGLSLLIVRLVNRLPLGAAMTLAVRRINRSSLASALQFGALALSLMLLAVIWLVRTDLLQDWQQTIPEDSPNAFAINIAPLEKESYLRVIDQNKLERSDAFPVIRGRISEINGVDVKVVPNLDRENDALRRELNFTWAEQLPESNQLISGNWSNQNGVSVEADVAEALNLSLGDELGFVVGGRSVNAVVNSVREVEWREMKPNFYFIFTPDVMAELPTTWMVSFRVLDDQAPLLRKLALEFPTVSLLDIRAMGDKIRGLLTQIIWSITVLAGLGVIAGLLLIFTLLRLSLSQRLDEIRLYRTLGASKTSVTRTIWSEYGLMAVTAGMVATMGAELSVASIMNWGFDLAPSLHFSLWLVLPLLAIGVLYVVVNSLIRKLLKPIVANTVGF